MSSWSFEPELFADVVEEDLAKLRTDVALEAHRGFVFLTKVDTGTLRRNYVITYGSPYDGPPIEGAGKGSNAEAISKGFQQLASGARLPYAKVFITNSLPYAAAQEFGTVNTPAVGMVSRTMARIRARFGR